MELPHYTRTAAAATHPIRALSGIHDLHVLNSSMYSLLGMSGGHVIIRLLQLLLLPLPIVNVASFITLALLHPFDKTNRKQMVLPGPFSSALRCLALNE